MLPKKRKSPLDRALKAAPGVGAVVGGAMGAKNTPGGPRAKALGAVLGAGVGATTGWIPTTLRDAYHAVKTAQTSSAFWDELEKIAASLADPVLRAIAKKRMPMKGTPRTGDGKKVLETLKARAKQPKGPESLTRRVEAQSPEQTFDAMDRKWSGTDPQTQQPVTGGAFLQAYGRTAPEQYQSMRAAQQGEAGWAARFQEAPTMPLNARPVLPPAPANRQEALAAKAQARQQGVQMAQQKALLAQQAGPPVAPPRVATPAPPAVGAAPVQPVGSGLLGTLRQRLFGTGTLPGTVKTSSVFTEIELEAFRRELSVIAG